MWVDPARRGQGIGRRLLGALEDEARWLGAQAARLDTAASLHEARGLYASAGYAETPAYTTTRTRPTGSRSPSTDPPQQGRVEV